MDEAAFERFYAETAPGLYRFLRHMVTDPDLAEDLLQSAFTRFLQHPPAWGEPGQVRAYLYRIATRLVYDHTRRRRRFLRFLRRQRPAAEDPLRAEHRDPDLLRLFARLPVKDRMMLWLAYVEGYQHDEIARLMGLRPKSMGVLLYRARRRFAQMLREAGYAPGDGDTPRSTRPSAQEGPT